MSDVAGSPEWAKARMSVSKKEVVNFEVQATMLAEGIIRRIGDASAELIFVRNELFDDDGQPADVETIKADLFAVLMGHDSGCIDPEELDATNCEFLAVEEMLLDLKTKQLAAAQEDIELLKACNESMAQGNLAVWRALEPSDSCEPYEGELRLNEYAKSVRQQLEAAQEEVERLTKEREDALANADFWERELNNFRRNAAHRAEQLAEEKVTAAESSLASVKAENERMKEIWRSAANILDHWDGVANDTKQTILELESGLAQSIEKFRTVIELHPEEPHHDSITVICAEWKRLDDGCVARCDKTMQHDGAHVDSVIDIGWHNAKEIR